MAYHLFRKDFWATRAQQRNWPDGYLLVDLGARKRLQNVYIMMSVSSASVPFKDYGTHPVATRNSLIELRSEWRQNSPEAEFEICIWLEFGACIKILLSATIADIRGPGVRVSLGRMKLNSDHISSNPGCSSFSVQSFWYWSVSQVWQRSVSRFMTSEGFLKSFFVVAQQILPSMSNSSVFLDSESSS